MAENTLIDKILALQDKYNALPAKIRAILDNAAEAAGQDMAGSAPRGTGSVRG